MKIKNIYIFLCLLLLIIGCSLSGTEEETNNKSSNEELIGSDDLVARIDLDERGYVNYYSDNSETLITEACLKNIEDKKSYYDLNTEEFYELMTGQAPPEKLIELLSNINDASEMDSDEDGEDEVIVPQTASNNINGSPNYSSRYVGILSAEQFREGQWINTSYYAQKVWTNVTGYGSVKRKTKKMVSEVHCYSGSVTNRIEYKKGTKNKSKADTVNTGYTSILEVSSSSKKWKKAKIHNADGDGYHAWIWWRK